MKTRPKVICLICATVVTLSACRQNIFYLQNARNTAPEITTRHQAPAGNPAPAKPHFSPNYLEEIEYQLELFSSRFFGSMSLPHQPPVH